MSNDEDPNEVADFSEAEEPLELSEEDQEESELSNDDADDKGKHTDKVFQGSPNFAARGPHQLLNRRLGPRNAAFN